MHQIVFQVVEMGEVEGLRAVVGLLVCFGTAIGSIYPTWNVVSVAFFAWLRWHACIVGRNTNVSTLVVVSLLIVCWSISTAPLLCV